ncbi:MAG: GGDEF domain-containing protein [Acetobacteraceae bacterium]|nr:GGDEF domain-containing protein [Acetobacteraceae bacterium]
MIFDIQTLLVIGNIAALIPGLLLPIVWLQERSATCLLTWGFGHLISAVALSVELLRPPIPAGIAAQFSHAAMLIYYATVWGAVRQFEGRRLLPLGMAAGPVLCLAACQIPAFDDALVARVTLVSAGAGIYSLAAALELLQGRQERLPSRWFLISLLALLCLQYALRPFLVPSLPFAQASPLPGGTGLPPMLTIVSSFLLLNLVKERAMLRHQEVARIDLLTGASNRRGFLEAAARHLASRRYNRVPTAVLLLMDLDHFKQINDRFGHAVGDSVLHLFAAVARAELAPDDVFGRLGGEEFAALLPWRDLAEAMAVADRIRRAFALAGASVAGCQVGARVSIGMAAQNGTARRLEDLLQEADAALYRAKANGRDRVELPVATLPRPA